MDSLLGIGIGLASFLLGSLAGRIDSLDSIIHKSCSLREEYYLRVMDKLASKIDPTKVNSIVLDAMLECNKELICPEKH